MKNLLILIFTFVTSLAMCQTGNFSTLRVYNLNGYVKAHNDTLATASNSIPVGDIEGLASMLVYDGMSPTTVTIGGLSAGSSIADSSFSYILEKMLTPYQQPAFTSFSMSGQSTAVEVGSTVSGSKNFTFGFSNSENIAPATLDVYDVTAGVYLATNLVNSSPAAVNIGTVTKTTATSNSWRGSADNTLAQTFTSNNYTINWRWRRWHGFSSTQTLTNAQILALSNTDLGTAKGLSITTISPSGDQYYVFAYPTTFGQLTAIYVNGFPSLDAFTRITQSVTNAYGVAQDYYIYYSNNTFNSTAEITYQ